MKNKTYLFELRNREEEKKNLFANNVDYENKSFFTGSLNRSIKTRKDFCKVKLKIRECQSLLKQKKRDLKWFEKIIKSKKPILNRGLFFVFYSNTKNAIENLSVDIKFLEFEIFNYSKYNLKKEEDKKK